MAPKPQVPPISPPTPPVPSAPPKVPAAPVKDPTDLARSLAKKLREGHRDEVQSAVEALGTSDLDALARALVPALSKDRNKAQGAALRSVIRFVRLKLSTTKGEPFTVSGGQLVREAEAKVSTGVVTLRTQVHVDAPYNKSDDAYSLTYTGSDASDMHWLQFIWRRVVPMYSAAKKGDADREGKPVKMRLDHASVAYHLTTDPAKPRWTTDSSVEYSAFYEENTFVERSTGELAMFDFPTRMPTTTLATELFKAAPRPKAVVSRFHAATYLVKGLDVLYRAEIDLTWQLTSDTDTPRATVEAKGSPAKALEAQQRACLALQHPEFDYFPGPAIGDPQPLEDFDPVPDLAPGDWDSKTKTNMDRFADVAHLAHAELIDDVTGMSATSINSGTPKPGLNFSSKISEEGQTGFIDANDAYKNPELPTDRDLRLPQVAMLLGTHAFEFGGLRDKAFSVATMRHEMMHAAHSRLAIGWLLKWRDEFTDIPFKDSFEIGKPRISKRPEFCGEIVLPRRFCHRCFLRPQCQLQVPTARC